MKRIPRPDTQEVYLKYKTRKAMYHALRKKGYSAKRIAQTFSVKLSTVENSLNKKKQ